jgi:actin-related protein
MEQRAIVIDPGSSVFKFGFAGSEQPELVVPSLIGIHKKRRTDDLHHNTHQATTTSDTNYVFGDDALAIRDASSLRYPIEHGHVKHWQDFERLCHYAYSVSGVDSEQHPVLMTDSVFNSRSNREQLGSTMFEEFNVPTYYVAMQPVLSLYAAGRTSGLVIDSGHSRTHAVPVLEGIPNTTAIYESAICGASMTDVVAKYLGPLLEPYCMNRHEFESVVNDIKNQRICINESRTEDRITATSASIAANKSSNDAMDVVAAPTTTTTTSSSSSSSTNTTASSSSADTEASSSTSASTTTTSSLSSSTSQLSSSGAMQTSTDNTQYVKYTFTNGRALQLPMSELLACGETLFHPSNSPLGPNALPLHHAAYYAITECRQENRRMLFENVLLAGGNTLYRGTAQRMRKELCAMTPGLSVAHVIAPDDRHVSAWIGGGIVCSLPFFQQTCVTKQEYDEVYASIQVVAGIVRLTLTWTWWLLMMIDAGIDV